MSVRSCRCSARGYDPDEESYYGRTYADSPDIDGKIWFTAEKHIKTGDFVDVHVVDTYDGDLSAYWRKNTMTTASKITLVRVVLIPVYMVLMLLSANGADWLRWAAVAVFVIASISDFLDGYIARHYNQVSDFGKFPRPAGR